ncbi:MAG: hypothetical protein Q9161_007958 [Pseudevernia consocians]
MHKNFGIVDLYETKPHNGAMVRYLVLGLDACSDICLQIVREASAAPQGHSDFQRIKLDADHLDLVNYSGEGDPNYKETIKELLCRVARASRVALPNAKKKIRALHIRFDKSSYDRYRFIPRQAICSKLHSLMKETFCNPKSKPGGVQTVIGSPGMGKTFLVHWFAETYDEWFSCQFFVDASCEDSLIQELRSVATRLGLNTSYESADIVNRMRQWLEENQGWLLILENVPPDFNFTRYSPSRPKGLVLIVTNHYNLDPIDTRFLPIVVDAMSPTKAYDEFLIELSPSLSEDHIDSSSSSTRNHRLDLDLTELRQQLSSSSPEIHEFLEVLGTHPLMIRLGVGWVRSKLKMYGLKAVLKKSVKEFRAHGDAEDLSNFVAVKMLLELLMNQSKTGNKEDQQHSMELLRFFAVIDHTGLPESLFKFAWTNIKRKKEKKKIEALGWKLLEMYLGEEWDTHPIHKSLTSLINISLINVRKHADPVDDSKPWFSMHPALHSAVRRKILLDGNSRLAACSSAVAILAEMTSLSPGSDSRISGFLDLRRSRQVIQKHMHYCFRLCYDVQTQLYVQGDSLVDRIDVRKYAKACSENGMVKRARDVQASAIKALDQSAERGVSVKRMLVKMRMEEATSLYDLGKHRKALDLRKDMLKDMLKEEATDQKVYGPDLIRDCKINLARSYHYDGQNVNALQLIEEVKFDSKLPKPEQSPLCTSVDRLKASILYDLESRRPNALQIRQNLIGVKDAEDMDEQLSVSDIKSWSFSKISLLGDLATSYHTAGWLLVARKIRELVREHRRQWFRHVPKHHDILNAQYNLTITLQSLGDINSALKLLGDTQESCDDELRGSHLLIFKVNLSLAALKIDKSPNDCKESAVDAAIRYHDDVIKGKDNNLRQVARNKKEEVLTQLDSPVRNRAGLDLQKKRLSKMEKSRETEKSTLDECYKRAYAECQPLQRAGIAGVNEKKENPLSLRLMLSFGDAYHKLSSNKCKCFHAGDICNRRRMSTAMESASTMESSTSDIVKEVAVENCELSDDFDRLSIPSETNHTITQESWYQYHDYWRVKAQYYRKTVYDMKHIFQSSELGPRATEAYIQSLQSLEPSERDLSQIMKMYEEVIKWKERFIGRDHHSTQRTHKVMDHIKREFQSEKDRRAASDQATVNTSSEAVLRGKEASVIPTVVGAFNVVGSPSTKTEEPQNSQKADAGEFPNPQPKRSKGIVKWWASRK